MAGNTAKIHVVLQGFKNDHGGIAFFYHGLTAQIQRFHDNVMSHQFTVDQRYFYTFAFFGAQDGISDTVNITPNARSEEHTSELQSLMRNSYAVFCLNTKQICTEKRTQHTDL